MEGAVDDVAMVTGEALTMTTVSFHRNANLVT